MRIKIGDRVYDSRAEPILVQLSPREKQAVVDMQPLEDLVCWFPEGMPPRMVTAFQNSMPPYMASVPNNEGVTATFDDNVEIIETSTEHPIDGGPSKIGEVKEAEIATDDMDEDADDEG